MVPVLGVACGAASIWLVVGIINGRHRDSEYGINWPVVTRYIMYAAIVGILLVLAGIFFPQVR